MNLAQKLKKVANEKNLAIQENEDKKEAARKRRSIKYFLAEAPKIFKKGIKAAEKAAGKGEDQVEVYKLYDDKCGDVDTIRSNNQTIGVDVFENVSPGLALLVKLFRQKGFQIIAHAVSDHDDARSDFSHYSICISWRK
jgi:hypothetical protein